MPVVDTVGAVPQDQLDVGAEDAISGEQPHAAALAADIQRRVLQRMDIDAGLALFARQAAAAQVDPLRLRLTGGDLVSEADADGLIDRRLQ